MAVNRDVGDLRSPAAYTFDMPWSEPNVIRRNGSNRWPDFVRPASNATFSHVSVTTIIDPGIYHFLHQEVGDIPAGDILIANGRCHIGMYLHKGFEFGLSGVDIDYNDFVYPDGNYGGGVSHPFTVEEI